MFGVVIWEYSGDGGQKLCPLTEDNKGYPKFLDWDEFWTEFWKDFCLAHADVAAINKLESTTYYQKTRSVDDYLDKFLDLIMEAGYMDPKISVVKF